ncbi:MAG: hypothetical protein AB1405_06775, partial [Bdellovibrionota bacterium]
MNLRHFWLFFVFTSIALSSSARAVDPDTDPAFWQIRLGGQFARWADEDLPVLLEVSDNTVCQGTCTSSSCDCASFISSGSVAVAVNRAAAEWNDAMVGEGLLPSTAFGGTSFFRTAVSTAACTAGSCTLSTFTPYRPDPTLGDNAG